MATSRKHAKPAGGTAVARAAAPRAGRTRTALNAVAAEALLAKAASLAPIAASSESAGVPAPAPQGAAVVAMPLPATLPVAAAGASAAQPDVAAATVGSTAALQPASGDVIRLGAQCTIREAVQLRTDLLDRVDAVEPIGLDAGGVHKVDTAGFQVLLVFARQRRDAGSATVWTGCSEVFHKAAVALDLDAALGLDARAAS